METSGKLKISGEKTFIERADYPEQVGVSSAAIAAFIEDLNKNTVEVHSLMILRRGKVAFERWAKPLGPDIPHVMFSVSKSVTAAALGFAIDEGLISLDTRVIDIFPEYAPPVPDENLEKLNIFHLVTMTAGKDVPSLSDKARGTWMKDFFEAKWAFEPGTFWRYISENTYMISAAITRVTGMSMSEYLTPRLYEPLGFGRVPFWETDGKGVDAGGWGLYLTTEELAKFTLCWQQGGMYDGRQVIPADWAKQAVKKQVENLQYYDVPDSSCGYGYGFWMNPVKNSYRSDGLFSQFGVVFEDEEACLIMTSNEIFEDKARACIWRNFPGVFVEPQPLNSVKKVPDRLLELKSLPEAPQHPRSSDKESLIEGRVISVKGPPLTERAGLPLSMLMLPAVKLNYERLGFIKEVRFNFFEDYCEMTWREGRYKNTIQCGFDGEPRFSNIRISQLLFTASSTAVWEDEKTLTVWMRPLENVGQRRMRFVFEQDSTAIFPGGVPNSKDAAVFFKTFAGYFIKPSAAVKAIDLGLTVGHKIFEPPLMGIMEKRQ